MTTVFGEVATTYDDVRPGYPASLTTEIAAYAGPLPHGIVEIGAGTGKATGLFTPLGAPVTCVEPDPRMAAVLTRHFPRVTVVISDFESWTAPAGGVSLLGCALAWHWLDPATRGERARAALAPGGTVAVLGHKFGFADPTQRRALDAVQPPGPDRPVDWFHDEIAAAFTDVRVTTTRRHLRYDTDRYLRLVETYGPFRQQHPDTRQRLRDGIRAAVTAAGGTLDIDLHTALVLGRRDG